MDTNMTAERLIAVGSYTEPYEPFRARGEGVTLLRFDPATGRLAGAGQVGALVNPSWLTAAPGALLAVCEADAARSCIATIDVHARRVIGTASVPGDLPCHLAIHPGGAWAACPCYGSGEVFVFALAAGAGPGARHAHLRHAGSGPNPERQKEPHPHGCLFSPDGRWLLVPDLGTDEIWIYAFDASTGTPRPASRHKLPPGTGPRLALFSTDGSHVLLALELASAVVSLRWTDGVLHAVATHAALFAPHAGGNTSAGVRWHPAGTCFGVSNRGANRIALFRYDSGRITPMTEIGSGGLKPRDFEFSPCGRWLLAANQDSDTIMVFALDVAAGTIAATGCVHAVRSPSCVRFLPG
jgi:6-phosphogluconolactonase